ncbi:MAG: cache domain-containing protein [Syntrophobacteraceae bacterium]
MNLNLRKKILLPSLALFVLLMGTSFGITYYLSAKSLDEKASKQLGDVARSRAELIDIWVEELQSLARSSALRPEYEAVLKTNTAETAALANIELAEQVKIHAGLSYINIADPQGVVRASSIPDAVGKVKVGDREYFKQGMQGKANVSDVYVARTTGKPAFAIAAPIRNGERVIGVLVCVPDLVKFSERIIDPVKVFDSGYAAITDTVGTVFAHKDKSLIMKLNLKDHDFGREMLSLKQGQVSYSFQNRRQVGAVERCGTTNWMILAAVPQAEIVEDAHKVAAINGLIFLSGLIATILVLYLVSRLITAPIDRLMQGLSAGASQVSAAAAHVSSASQELAEGASEQAASIEETSSSLEEMSAMTRMNAQNADVANNSMIEATNELSEAQASFTKLNDSMLEIAAAGEETQKIIKTIDEIAFQTNLLALNASGRSGARRRIRSGLRGCCG